jgi:hypothetical protein
MLCPTGIVTIMLLPVDVSPDVADDVDTSCPGARDDTDVESDPEDSIEEVGMVAVMSVGAIVVCASVVGAAAAVVGAAVVGLAVVGAVVDCTWFNGVGNGLAAGTAKPTVGEGVGTAVGVAVMGAGEDSDAMAASNGRTLLVGCEVSTMGGTVTGGGVTMAAVKVGEAVSGATGAMVGEAVIIVSGEGVLIVTGVVGAEVLAAAGVPVAGITGAVGAKVGGE